MNSKSIFSIPLLLFRQLRSTILNIYRDKEKNTIEENILFDLGIDVEIEAINVVSPKNGDG